MIRVVYGANFAIQLARTAQRQWYAGDSMAGPEVQKHEGEGKSSLKLLRFAAAQARSRALVHLNNDARARAPFPLRTAEECATLGLLE